MSHMPQISWQSPIPISMIMSVDIYLTKWLLQRRQFCWLWPQSKGSLVGYSNSNTSADTRHLSKTYINKYWYTVPSCGPLLRFGTAHVYKLVMPELLTSWLAYELHWQCVSTLALIATPWTQDLTLIWMHKLLFRALFSKMLAKKLCFSESSSQFGCVISFLTIDTSETKLTLCTEVLCRCPQDVVLGEKALMLLPLVS